MMFKCVQIERKRIRGQQQTTQFIWFDSFFSTMSNNKNIGRNIIPKHNQSNNNNAIKTKYWMS